MTIVLTFIHVVVCLFLIVVVLLQSGKAADLAGAFGGMGSQTAFGPRGSATLLSKATTLAAAIFMITSITLSIVAQRSAASSGSVLEREKAPAKSAPAKPGASPAPVAPAPQSSVPVTIPPAPPQPAPANKK
jgi:preprotein translocase subunit SecG